ncbi:type III-B CRISPR module RAMP protein Cmr1 [Herpetosiphon gulosus]|uniref:CRISPR type III-associated protein domain-containing protein n=1 Tax=Herpetosiphon gulosus TaxID=1973496 RepID=A0ABP9X6U9_9CHLR
MFKRKPSAEPPKIEIPDKNKSVTIIRSYRVITPLMGGGVRTNQNDLSFLIRPTSIRGQLRFWWRACFGGSANLDTDTLPDETAQQRWLLEQMFERESAIFGQAAYYSEDSSEPKKVIGKGASAIQIEVNVTNKGKTIQYPHHKKGLIPIYDIDSPYSYAAFPLKDAHDPLINIEFTLTIRLNYADQRGELEKVLWAWQTFGGIGARTRRGFGVLQRIDSQVDHYAFTNKAQLERQIKEIIGNRSYWPNDVPHLSAKMQLRLLNLTQDPLKIWADLLKRYKEFRQQRNESDQPNRPGRSRWPEPDALRRLTRQRSRMHERPVSELDAFPRGEFGLPIMFHFKDSDDPVDSELRLQASSDLKQQKGDRFASPMLLKPVASNGQLFGLIAVLEGSTLNGRQPIIKNRRITAAAVTIEVSENQARTIVDNHRHPILTTSGVITSFLATIEEE